MRKLLNAKEAIGKVVCTSLGHVIVGLSVDKQNVSRFKKSNCYVIKTNDRFPISSFATYATMGGHMMGENKYMQLSKKDLKKLFKGTLETEYLRIKFEKTINKLQGKENAK